MSPPAVTGVLETSLYVEDVERSCEFYTSIFSFSLLYTEARMCALSVPGAHVLLLFRKGGSTEAVHTSGGTVPAHDGTGNLHLTFSIASDALASWQDWLADRGIVIESTVRWPKGGTSFYLRDPDGHLIELATPGLWENY